MFEEIADKDLIHRSISQGGPMQQAMIAELQSRQNAGLHTQFSNVEQEISNIRRELAKVQVDLLKVQERLENTHRIHVWILVFAIPAALFAGIASLDVIWHWIKLI